MGCQIIQVTGVSIVPQDGAARQHQGIKLPLRHVGQIQLAAHGTQAMAHQHKAICLHARLDQPQKQMPLMITDGSQK